MVGLVRCWGGGGRRLRCRFGRTFRRGRDGSGRRWSRRCGSWCRIGFLARYARTFHASYGGRLGRNSHANRNRYFRSSTLGSGYALGRPHRRGFLHFGSRLGLSLRRCRPDRNGVGWAHLSSRGNRWGDDGGRIRRPNGKFRRALRVSHHQAPSERGGAHQ
jgi:hypothetical protein